MPRLALSDHELVVHLTAWESVWSLRRSFRVPLTQIRGATDDNGFAGDALGLRLPGTHIPGLITAGTFIKGSDKQFVYKIGCTTCVAKGDRSWSTYRPGADNSYMAAMDRWIFHLDEKHPGAEAPCLAYLPEAQGRLQERREHEQQRRLAGTVRPDQRRDLAGAGFERHIAHRLHGPERPREPGRDDSRS